jgi:hypothetical protein
LIKAFQTLFPQAPPIESCRIQLDDAFAATASKNQRKVSMKLFFSMCAAFALCICGASLQLHGKTTTDVTATVQFSNGQSVSVAGSSDLIGIQPRELVNVRLQFTPDAIGQPVIVEALDGGSTGIGSSIRVVEADGTLSFAFLATAKPGPRSIGIRSGSRTFRLRFWVLDLANPQNNPSTLTAVSHS